MHVGQVVVPICPNLKDRSRMFAEGEAPTRAAPRFTPPLHPAPRPFRVHPAPPSPSHSPFTPSPNPTPLGSPHPYPSSRYYTGAYPGVDFRIMQIRDKDGGLIFENEPGATLDIRPLYPLVKALEREWPVSIPESVS